MGRLSISMRVSVAAVGAATALLAAGCASGSSATHSTTSGASSSSASASATHNTSQVSGSPSSTSSGFDLISGPTGEPELDAKCEMEPSQQNLPTFQLSLSSPSGTEQGVQSASITFNNGVAYVASFNPITVPSTGVATMTTTAAAYPPNDSMPVGCKVTAYNEP